LLLRLSVVFSMFLLYSPSECVTAHFGESPQVFFLPFRGKSPLIPTFDGISAVAPQ
jgi:hypothetical protein